jgi:hypothetical protein
MKELLWKNDKGKWVVHYRRPDNHPDVKEWENYLARAEPWTRYKIRTVKVVGEGKQP